MDVEQMINYTQCLLRVAALKIYRSVLTKCKESAKELAGDQWDLGNVKELSTEKLWTWSKEDGIGEDGYSYLVLEKCVNFEKEPWFELGKCIWRKYISLFQDHLKDICNDIVKPFRVGILR